MTGFDERDCRFDSMLFGLDRKLVRITHIPTGLVVDCSEDVAGLDRKDAVANLRERVRIETDRRS